MEILIVDQDLPFARRLEKKISRLGHSADLLACCALAAAQVLQRSYDLLIINVKHTGDAGSQFIESFSQLRHTPVIVTSTNGEVAAKIHHLNLGAVDYVVKPVDFEELMARITLQLRKATPSSAIAAKLVFGDLVINLASGSVERGGQSISLTTQEFATLLYLARHQGKPVSRQQLFENVWGGSHAHRANVINVAMGRLRRKIDASFERKWIHTVHGVGYVAEYRD